MGTVHKTSCVLCAQNCGLEVEVENNRILKVKGDKENVRSEGYVCRKGISVAYHQHNADRLKYPLKRKRDGFERISWDQAIEEIPPSLKGLSTDTVLVLLPIWAAEVRHVILRPLLGFDYCVDSSDYRTRGGTARVR